MKNLWPTGITSHSIYAVVGMQYPPGALAQNYMVGLSPRRFYAFANTAYAVPGYFYSMDMPIMSFQHCGPALSIAGDPSVAPTAPNRGLIMAGQARPIQLRPQGETSSISNHKPQTTNHKLATSTPNSKLQIPNSKL